MSSIRIPALLATSFLAMTLMTGCSSLGFGKSKARAQAEKISAAQAQNMGLNSFLCRASIETLNFMPLDQVDPFGGVIITDWYASAAAPNERFKANVYILDTNLRADALKTSIFKQTRSAGGWQDAATDADTARQIENSILTRARELYIATVDAG